MPKKTDTTPGIDRETLESAYKKALLYAERKLNRFSSSSLLSKITPEDVANEAVAKTLSGKRPWNKEKYPDLFVHLAGCISSEISNNYNSTDYRQIERGDASNELVSSAACNNQDASNSIEYASKVKFILDYLISAKKDLSQVAEIVLRYGINEPRDIAESLNISVAEVNTKKQALKRLMQNTDFERHYIEKNRPDLSALMDIVYANKAATDEEISFQLGIPVKAVHPLRDELNNAVKDIYKGII